MTPGERQRKRREGVKGGPLWHLVHPLCYCHQICGAELPLVESGKCEYTDRVTIERREFTAAHDRYAAALIIPDCPCSGISLSRRPPWSGHSPVGTAWQGNRPAHRTEQNRIGSAVGSDGNSLVFVRSSPIDPVVVALPTQPDHNCNWVNLRVRTRPVRHDDTFPPPSTPLACYSLRMRPLHTFRPPGAVGMQTCYSLWLWLPHLISSTPCWRL
jgi:hypothetical protein